MPWCYIHANDHYFQTSSPKPLGQSKPNFIWSLLGKGGKKVYMDGPGHMTKIAATPIYGKNLQKIIFFPEPEVLCQGLKQTDALDMSKMYVICKLGLSSCTSLTHLYILQDITVHWTLV